jgi:DNA polymerase-4
MSRWILHADMDAFYASIEQRDHPELRGRPVIVGAVSGRGVVAAASYEARQFGVRSAMPGFRAHELCPGGVFLPSNMRRYAAVSAQIQDIFRDFTPLVEPLALDEAFLDISGSAHLFGGGLATARELKRRVREVTELSVSVGLAPNKLVAKIACSLGKPDGLRVVEAAGVQAVLDPLPVGWLWGVGPVLERELGHAGIETVAQLRTCGRAALEALIGPRANELQTLARGEDERPVEADRAPKSYGEENTFEEDVSDRRVIEDALIAHADAVARRVRNDGYQGRTITLKIKLGRADRSRHSARGPHYPLLSRSRTLPEATDDGTLIGRVACELFAAAGLGEPVRLLGVSLSGLSAPSAQTPVSRQLSLFDAPEPRDPLGPALDAITRRFGVGAIRRAVTTPDKITHGRAIKRGESGRRD